MKLNYIFTNNIRNTSAALIILGLIGLGYGFLTAPSSISEAKEIISNTHHSDGHSPEKNNGNHQESNHSSSSHTENKSVDEIQNQEHKNLLGFHHL